MSRFLKLSHAGARAKGQSSHAMSKARGRGDGFCLFEQVHKFHTLLSYHTNPRTFVLKASSAGIDSLPLPSLLLSSPSDMLLPSVRPPGDLPSSREALEVGATGLSFVSPYNTVDGVDCPRPHSPRGAGSIISLRIPSKPQSLCSPENGVLQQA